MTPADRLHPALVHHIVNTLGWPSLRPFQQAAIDPVLDGAHTLLIAPTAGGKTEAAFFPVLSRMMTETSCTSGDQVHRGDGEPCRRWGREGAAPAESAGRDPSSGTRRAAGRDAREVVVSGGHAGGPMCWRASRHLAPKWRRKRPEARSLRCHVRLIAGAPDEDRAVG